MDVYGRYIYSYKWAYKPTIITQGVTKLWCEDQTWFMIRDCILDSIKQLISGAVNLCTHSAGARTAYLWSSSVYDRATWCHWPELWPAGRWSSDGGQLQLDFRLSSGKTPEISENSLNCCWKHLRKAHEMMVFSWSFPETWVRGDQPVAFSMGEMRSRALSSCKIYTLW